MIERTPEGIWVVAGDSHIGAWVREGKGMHRGGDSALEAAMDVIKPGDCVVDVGCNIGGHAVHYAKAVGPEGSVIGFEPNSDAFECSRRNVGHPSRIINVALGAEAGTMVLNVPYNVGAAYLSREPLDDQLFPPQRVETVEVVTMDEELRGLKRLDLLKIDAEGAELDVLAGATGLIRKFRPIILVEVNRHALARNGAVPGDLLLYLSSLGYKVTPIPLGIATPAEQYDLLCHPRP